MHKNPEAKPGDFADVDPLRLPLHSIEAEMSVLGSMILAQRAAEEIGGYLKVEDFFRPAHRTVFMALKQLLADHKEIDIVTLRTVLIGRDQLGDVGGVDYLLQLAEYVPSSANAKYYAGIVRDKSMLRGLEEIGRRVIDYVHDPEIDHADEKLEKSIDSLLGFAKNHVPPDSTVMDIGRAVKSFMRKIDDRQECGEFAAWNNPNMVPSMFDPIQTLIRGYERGCLYTVGAPASMGKTAYVVQELINFACQGHPVLFVTREMSPERIIRRFISKLSKVPLQRIRDDFLNEHEYRAVGDAAASLESLPIRFLASPEASVADVKREAILLSRATSKPCIIGDDYIQLAVDDVSVKEITKFMRGYRSLTNELGSITILLSQMNRSYDGERLPQMSDLTGSNSIDANSDVVMLLNRPEYWEARKRDPQTEKDRSAAHFHVVKNRDFPIGKAVLMFRPAFTEFIA